MKVNEVRLLPLSLLRPNPENPKKPFNAVSGKGLRESLRLFGFAGVCIVAPDPDGTYVLLDANTRYEELKAAGVEEVPCVVMADLTTRAARRQFVLSYDRHKKPFDEEEVLRQLREMVEQGENVRQLRSLLGAGDVREWYGELEAGVSAGALQELEEMGGPQGSLLLTGPAADIAQIRSLLQSMRVKLSSSRKVLAVLGQAVTLLDWEDERLLAVLLATVARFRGETQNTEVEA